MKNFFLTVFLFMAVFVGFSQNVASSPYAVFGLGSLYDADFGITPAIGGSGMALPSDFFINNKNPASLAFINKNSFFFEVGGTGILSNYQNAARKESSSNIQFSHLAFAFPVTSKSGASVLLMPYSSAGYEIRNIRFPIANSAESYSLDANSSGGLNNLEVAYGYKIGKKMTLGANASLLFGNIVDNKTYSISNAKMTINRDSYYTGLRFTIGNQYQIDSTLTVAARIKLPTQIHSGKVQSVANLSDTGTTILESEAASEAEDYYLPFEIGVGFSKKIHNQLNLTFDYDKSLWNSVNQSGLYGSYTNQDRFAAGISYEKKGVSRFSKKIRFSGGVNYDTGFLKIGDDKVNNISVSAGIGFPIEQTRSYFNISYSYGQQGRISSELIKESYHKIGLNLSLEGLWFVKRRFD